MRICTIAVVLWTFGACSHEMDSSEVNLPLKNVRDEIFYVRHEPHPGPEEFTGNLLSFVYDIPYFGACGVFPPFHVINQQFAAGGSDGGMSPGASWPSFAIDKQTYDELLSQVRETDPESLKGKSRYLFVKFIEDSSFDSIQDWMDWYEAACKKHREWYHRESTKNAGL